MNLKIKVQTGSSERKSDVSDRSRSPDPLVRTRPRAGERLKPLRLHASSGPRGPDYSLSSTDFDFCRSRQGSTACDPFGQRFRVIVGTDLDGDALFEIAEPSVLPLRELAGSRLNQLDQRARR